MMMRRVPLTMDIGKNQGCIFVLLGNEHANDRSASYMTHDSIGHIKLGLSMRTAINDTSDRHIE
jgi:hypothetical protein